MADCLRQAWYTGGREGRSPNKFFRENIKTYWTENLLENNWTNNPWVTQQQTKLQQSMPANQPHFQLSTLLHTAAEFEELKNFIAGCVDQIIELNEAAVKAIMNAFVSSPDGMLEEVVLTPDNILFAAATPPPAKDGSTFYQQGKLPTGERGFFCSRSPILPIYCGNGYFWKATEHWKDIGVGETDVTSKETGAIVVYRPIHNIRILRIHPIIGGLPQNLATKGQFIKGVEKKYPIKWNLKELSNTTNGLRVRTVKVIEGVLRQMIKFDQVFLAAITRFGWIHNRNYQGWEMYAESDSITESHKTLGFLSPWVHEIFKCPILTTPPILSAEICLADPDQLTVEAWETYV